MTGNLDLMWLATSVPILLVVLEWWRSLQAGWKAKARQSKNTLVAKDAWPSVSVLIPAWSEAGTIDKCLKALGSVVYPCWEVIIIAGGPDNTYERVAQMTKGDRVSVLRQATGGKNAALNQGLALATGQVIVVLDADSIVSPYWLQALVYPLINGADATCGNYLPLRRTWISQTEEMEKTSAYLIHQQCILQGSGSIAIRRETLEEIGRFPVEVTTGVDWDLSMRLTKAGKIQHFAKEAFVWTHRPATLAEFWNNEVRWRRAHLQLLLSNYRQFSPDLKAILKTGRIYAVVLSLCLGLVLAIFCLLIGQYYMAASIFLGLALVVIMVSGRRAALAGEMASYTGNWLWLLYAWTPALLLLVSFFASGFALLTLNRRTVHFKGPR